MKSEKVLNSAGDSCISTCYSGTGGSKLQKGIHESKKEVIIWALMLLMVFCLLSPTAMIARAENRVHDFGDSDFQSIDLSNTTQNDVIAFFNPDVSNEDGTGLTYDSGKTIINKEGAWIQYNGLDFTTYEYVISYTVDTSNLSEGDKIRFNFGNPVNWHDGNVYLEHNNTAQQVVHRFYVEENTLKLKSTVSGTEVSDGTNINLECGNLSNGSIYWDVYSYQISSGKAFFTGNFEIKRVLRNDVVARIGNTNYSSLSNAVEAVTTSDSTTIELLADDTLTTGSIHIVADRNIIINGNNHTITFDGSKGTGSLSSLFVGNGASGFQNATLMVKNVTIKDSSAAYSKAIGTNSGATNANITFENCTFDNLWSAAYLNPGSGSLVIKNCLYNNNTGGGLWSADNWTGTVEITGSRYAAASMEVMSTGNKTITGNDFSTVNSIAVYDGNNEVDLSANYWKDGAQPTINAVSGSTGSYNYISYYTSITDDGSPTTGASFTLSNHVPIITMLPTASAITYGQKLSESNLTGGVATVNGTFAWQSPDTIPSVSESTQTVVFTPADSSTYDPVPVYIELTISKEPQQ